MPCIISYGNDGASGKRLCYSEQCTPLRELAKLLD
jgi:hypothetical protein